jgi:putative beta-lysine N-acetyltransferase
MIMHGTIDPRAALQRLLGPDCLDSAEPRGCAWPLGDGTTRELVFDPHNRRLKLFRLGPDDLVDPGIRTWRGGLDADGAPYTKLIVYGLPGREMAWVRQGYVREGVILGYFADGQDAWIWSAFADGPRDLAPRDAAHDAIVELAATKPSVEPELPEGYRCRTAGPDDADRVAALLQETFSAYPSPLDTDTVRARLEADDCRYRLAVTDGGELAAAAAAEIDLERRSAELTDCATVPEHRGAGLMAYLLHRLERDLARELDITDVYTIARADEVGMNCVFSKLGFVYTGRLVNNCRMPGGWESMNLWCRAPAEADDA